LFNNSHFSPKNVTVKSLTSNPKSIYSKNPHLTPQYILSKIRAKKYPETEKYDFRVMNYLIYNSSKN